jgi:hypothetical protein
LNPEDRIRIYGDIFQLIYNSNGGFTWNEVYSMPISTRYFNIKMLIHQREKEKEASEKQPDTNKSRPQGPPSKVLPRRTTK